MTDYKKDFPLLAGSDIAYLDNAATAQRPEAVLKAVEDFYTKKNANPLRGLYELGIEATEAYEAARERVREFINAGKTSEVVFTRNSTESLNLIAYSYGLTSLKAGDEILISIDNHHSNILPWQMVSRQTGAKLVYLECQPDGSYRDEDMEALVTEKTKIAAMPQISNVLGRRNPVEKLTKADKLKFLDYLDKKGAFLISKSGDRVCDHLHISKFTLYKYLEIVRGENNGSNLDEPAE